MSEFKGSNDSEAEEQGFAQIVKEERKSLVRLNKHIERLFWEIEKEQTLGDSDESKLTSLRKALRGDLYSYDMIVKRLIDLKQKAPESEEYDDEESGWKRDVIGLIKWANEGSEKHALMIRKVNKQHGNYKETSLLARVGRDAASQSTQRRSHIRRLD